MDTAETLSRKIKRVLVTGGGGFVGRAIVCRLLPYMEEVRVLGRNHYPDLAAEGVNCVVGDISCLADVQRAVKGVELVFHVAARAGIWGRWQDYYLPNVVGTENILQACHKGNIHHLVYTSTPSVVFAGESIVGKSAAELAHSNTFLCHYAKSKSIAEKKVLSSVSGQFLACAIRPHLVWGPGDPHLLPRLVAAGRAGKLKQVGDGSNLVDISYIDNVAEAHLCAALALLDSERCNQVNGKAYFLGQSQPENLWQWINTLFAALEIPSVENVVSYRAAYAAGALFELFYGIGLLAGWKKEPPMTRFVAGQLAKSHCFCHQATKRELGYTERVSTEEGIKRSVQWLKGICQ